LPTCACKREEIIRTRHDLFAPMAWAGTAGIHSPGGKAFTEKIPPYRVRRRGDHFDEPVVSLFPLHSFSASEYFGRLGLAITAGVIIHMGLHGDEDHHAAETFRTMGHLKGDDGAATNRDEDSRERSIAGRVRDPASEDEGAGNRIRAIVPDLFRQ